VDCGVWTVEYAVPVLALPVLPVVVVLVLVVLQNTSSTITLRVLGTPAVSTLLSIAPLHQYYVVLLVLVPVPVSVPALL
jgi:hypothetical protein